MTAAALRGMQIWEASGHGQGLDWLDKRGRPLCAALPLL
jgi:hypothetical protein